MSIKTWWQNRSFHRLGRGTMDSSAPSQGIAESTLDSYEPGLFEVQYEDVFKGMLVGTIPEIKQDLETLGGRLFQVISPTSFSTNSEKEFQFVWPNAYVKVLVEPRSLETSFCVSAGTSTLFDALCETVKKYLTKVSSAGRFFTIMNDESGMALKNVGVPGVPLQRENYEEEVLEAFDHIVSDLQSSDPCGRCIILDGSVGTGKSYIIRGLIDAVPKCVFVNVSPAMVASLSGPSFVSILLNTHRKYSGVPIVIVIEDADEVLAARALDNMSSISSLLNLSDGLLGSSLNIRVLATTNAGHLSNSTEGIDEAILRPGRLCRRVHVPKLSPQQAGKIYESLTGEKLKFTDDVSIAEVYLTAKTKGKWVPVKDNEKKFGFQVESDIYGDVFTGFDAIED